MTPVTQTDPAWAVALAAAPPPVRFTILPFTDGYWVFDRLIPVLGPFGHTEATIERDRLREEFPHA